jgi:hypothetical protein
LDWSKLYPGPPDATGMQQRILLRVTDSSQFRLNAPYLIAAIEPFQKDKQEWSVVLQEMRKEWVDGYTKDYLPKATIDSVYSTEIIDGVEFDKTYFKMRRLKTTEHRYVYSRIINGLTFHCAINYLDTVQGKIYTSMFRQSKFDK